MSDNVLANYHIKITENEDLQNYLNFGRKQKEPLENSCNATWNWTESSKCWKLVEELKLSDHGVVRVYKDAENAIKDLRIFSVAKVINMTC